ncbi:hypothetical protein ASF68_16025 [Plantibacter sp. Leaf314]|nr:hypothetical protein ASF68_16025 [Plantibacter sp. Leaf314]
MPIGQHAWRRHRDAIVRATEQFAACLPLPDESFNAIRVSALALTSMRNQILSMLLAAEPFTPFDRRAAEQLMRAIDEAMLSAAVAVREGTPSSGPSAQLRTGMSWWGSRDSPHDDDDALEVAFRLPASPIDASGQFRADWVFKHYAYKNTALLTRLLEHLDSLGTPAVPDILAGTNIIGSVLNCGNPVGAYSAMDTFVTSYLSAPTDVAAQALAHLHASESALRRTEQMVDRAFAAMLAGGYAEDRALALADMYKRITEGHFRQYAWVLYCLRNGFWEPTPMLTTLRERLIADGGFLAMIADRVVLPEMRNSEAHETLGWDGIDQEFVTETDRVGQSHVAVAVSEAKSFVAGCEAGLAAVRTLTLPSDRSPFPTPNEPGRTPAWRRALAFFGTNNLQLIQQQLNARDAELRVAQLGISDINPCFQALLTAHRLLPRIETFTVTAEENPATSITVSAAALRATMPSWEYAVSSLDRLPFATFLPANYDARRRAETGSAAVRAAAWIALDDVFDAINASPGQWNDSVLQVLAVRLVVVDTAVSQLVEFIGQAEPRLDSIAASLHDLRRWLERTPPVDHRAAMNNQELRRMRLQWEKWGPVARHPLVPERLAVESSEPQPAVLEHPTNGNFQTI